MFSRFLRFCVPSAAAAALVGVVVGLADTGPDTFSVFQALAGTGFLLAFAWPIGFFSSVFVRGLISGWRLSSLINGQTDQRGASPKLAAWVVFLLLSGLVLAIGTFQGMRFLIASTRILQLVALASPIVVLAICGVLFILSRPCLLALERLFTAIENKREARGKSAVVTPVRLAILVVTLLGIVLNLLWFFVIEPKVGYWDLSIVKYLVLFAVGLITFPLLWKRLESETHGHKILVSLAAVALFSSVGAATWTRYRSPFSMLEIWGQTRIAGWSIDSIYKVRSLRSQLSLDGIEPLPVTGKSHPNIVLISIDTVRADYLPLYGGNAKMPTLKALGEKGVVFERAYSPGNVTRRSLPSLVTGLSPRRVRGRVVGWALRMDPRHITLAERLRAGGYDTSGFFCCVSHFGKDRNLGLSRGIDHVGLNFDGALLSEKAIQWLGTRKNAKAPLFMWVHYFEPHRWEQDHKPKAGSRKVSERYKLSLKATDDNLEVLLKGIKEKLGPDTIIVLTSDHGEGLGDHKTKNHALSLYNSEIHVPLIVSGPGIKATRIQQAVGLADLAPTILDLAGFEPPAMPQIDGLSVAPEIRGERPDKLGMGEAYSVMVADRSVKKSQAALMSGRYKLIENASGEYKLYDHSSDPDEEKEVQDLRPKVFESMKARLKRRRTVDKVSPF